MGKVASARSEILEDVPMACADETAAVEFLERQRWGGSPACPKCGDSNVYQMKDRKTGGRNRRYLWRCRGCNGQYTVRVGTVMEDSPIPLRLWCHALWRAASSKKGISALQLKRETGLGSYSSALFMMHRIRLAMTTNGNGPLSGDVEADESYVGGKPRGPSKATPEYRKLTGYKSKPGRAPDFKDRKTPVFVAIERYGEARAVVPTDVNGENLRTALTERVHTSARLHTDEHTGYRKVGQEFEGGHYTVRHGKKEYARQEDGFTTHINTCESFFALLKRAVIGTYHAVSRTHLHRYVAGAEFRWNTRHLDDGERLRRLILGAERKRLIRSGNPA